MEICREAFLNEIDKLIAHRVGTITRDRYKGGPTLSELRINEALMAEKFAEWLFERFLKETEDV